MKPKLAIFELHHLGDAVMAIPFLKGAHTSYEVVVFCRHQVAELLNIVLPGIECRAMPESWAGRLKTVRADPTFDVAACVWPDTRAHAFLLASGAKSRVGFSVEETNFYASEIPWRKRRILAGRTAARLLETATKKPLLTTALVKPDPRQHHLQSWNQLAEALGISPDLTLPWIDPARFQFPIPEIASLGHQHPRIAVHPGGRLPTKRWQGFEFLLQTYFTNHKLPTVIVAAPEEPAPEPQSSDQVVIASPDFETLLCILAQTDVLLSNDSFAAHLAAALGKPTITIFGSGEPDWFAPFGNEQRTVCSRTCPHHPCIDRCVMPSILCLESVTQEMVIERLDAVLFNKG
jgi:ADP-heptose:LPS heptosyltransferase